ncbi:MAG: rhomboid family intrarane serine protease [Flaviaesturariibacter sp.]|nr:rhomboid family intrarane serine protease [Flaviaesturariibacter sp.]
MAYYPSPNRRKLSIGADGNALMMLIAVQLMVFILLAFIKVVYYFTYGAEGVGHYQQDILQWVTLPASLSSLAHRPWTVITHFLVHDGVWHLIANMLWLWAFGFIFQDLTGYRKLIPVFIYGALAGAVAFIAAYNLIPGLRSSLPVAEALGASAGVMAIAIATTVVAPDYRIFPMINGGIPLWVLTLVFAIIDLATIPYDNPGGHIAHLAGAGMGFLFATQMQRGRDWSGWMNATWDWITNLFNPDRPAKGRVIKSDLFYKASVPPFKKNSNLTQQKVDEILEKIHQKGYNSLSEDEKEILKRASKEDS